MTILIFDKPFEISPRLTERSHLRRCRLEECRGACCLHGVWVDPLERDDLLSHAGRISPHLELGRRESSCWFSDETEEEVAFPSGYVVAAQVVDNPGHHGGTECVFLRRDARCALQVAGESAGFHPWRFKPFHCIIHPLTFDAVGRITLASDDELMGEPGSCFRPTPQARPLADALASELDFLRSMAYGKIPALLEMPPSSSGPGRGPFKA
jgi:hypothetical protein